jgi:hypothetical protein
VTNLEESLCDYYATKAGQLVLTDRVFDIDMRDDATVSYISMGPEPRRRAPMLLAAAACIALLAGAGVVVSRNSGRTQDPAVISNATAATAASTVVAADQMPILAPTWLPDGYLLRSLGDGDGSSSQPHTIIFRDPTQPLGSPALIVNIDKGDPHVADGEAAITVQGQPATIQTSNGLTTIFMTDPKGLSIDVTGRSVGVDQLKAIAETITVTSADPSDGVDIGSLPPGFQVVLDQPASSRATRNANLEYGKPGSKTESLLIGISDEALPTDEMLAASMMAPDEPDVRGHKAWDLSATMKPGTSGITWTESPSLSIFLMSKGLDDTTVRRIAESLQPITPSEFAKMRVDHPAGSDVSAFGGPTPLEDPNPAATTAPAAGTVITTCEPQAVTTCGPDPKTTTNSGACSLSDGLLGSGVPGTVCGKLTTPPLWATTIPDGFSLSKIEESIGNNGNSRWHVLHYTKVGTHGLIGEIKFSTESGPGLNNWAAEGPPGVDTIDMNEIFVRGARAMIAQDATRKNPATAMSWRERPDLIVQITADSTTIEDLTRMAESLVPGTPGMLSTMISGGTFVVAAGQSLQGYVDPNATTTTTAAP